MLKCINLSKHPIKLEKALVSKNELFKGQLKIHLKSPAYSDGEHVLLCLKMSGNIREPFPPFISLD